MSDRIGIYPIQQRRVIGDISGEAETALALEVLEFFWLGVFNVERQGREGRRVALGWIWTCEVDLDNVSLVFEFVYP